MEPMDGEAGVAHFSAELDTYVGEENLASLRGCANAGFTLDHVRVTRHRLNIRCALWRKPDADARRVWAQAVAPRS